MNQYFEKRELLDAEDFKQLLPYFIEEIATSRNELLNQQENLELEELKQIVHKISGTSGSFGAKQIYSISQTLEEAAHHEQNAPILRAGIERLCRVIEDTLIFIQKEYQSS